MCLQIYALLWDEMAKFNNVPCRCRVESSGCMQFTLFTCTTYKQYINCYSYNIIMVVDLYHSGAQCART